MKFLKGEPFPIMNFEGARPGPYRVFVSTPTGRVLVNEDITVCEGLTLMEVRAKEPIEQPAPAMPKVESTAKIALPAPKNLYF